MIAQTPTLMEQATIDRLGVFDEEKLASIDLDATIPCDIERCPDPAVWRLSMRCCGRAWTYCDDCRDSVLRQARDSLATPGNSNCVHCRARFMCGTPLELVVRSVKL